MHPEIGSERRVSYPSHVGKLYHAPAIDRQPENAIHTIVPIKRIIQEERTKEKVVESMKQFANM